MLEIVTNVLVSALERKHPYTRGHSERVGAYSKALASKLLNPKLDEKMVELIWYGGRLHDIGKICVEVSTLNNPTRILTPEQVEELEDHPYHGVQILRKCGTEIPREIMNCVFHHHERYDGKHNGNLTGYPLGLSGTDIPLPARIVAVSDIYDALRSVRPYKDVLSTAEATETLCTMAGNHLDPFLVEIFLVQVVPELDRKRNE